MGVAATKDSTFDWRELGAQVKVVERLGDKVLYRPVFLHLDHV